MTRIFTILFAAASRAAVGVSEPVICRDDDEWRLEGGDVPSGVARTSSSRTLTAAPAAAPFSCAWVAEEPASRCGAVSERDASDACARTCGSGNADSATWYRKKPSKDCAWVGEDPLETTRRCAKGGTDPAIAACAAACDADCVPAPTPAPTTPGVNELGNDEGCVDDESWFHKKPAKDCVWVSKKVPQRCKAAAIKVKAKDACLATCGEYGEDSDAWFYKKENKDCAWIGKQDAEKIRKLCKKAGTDGESACPASCGGCDDGTVAPTAAADPICDAPVALSREYLQGFTEDGNWGTNIPNTIFQGDTFKYVATGASADGGRRRTATAEATPSGMEDANAWKRPPRRDRAPSRAAGSAATTIVVFDHKTCVDGATVPADTLLYDDGTHGDDYAGDGIYSRACLHLCTTGEAADREDMYDIHGFARVEASLGGRLVVVDPALRGTVPIVDLPTPAAERGTVKATSHAMFFADVDRSYMPEWPAALSSELGPTGKAFAATAATSVFGDVFHYVTVLPMEPTRKGGGGIYKWQDWTKTGGPTPDVGVGSVYMCTKALDGGEHPKLRGMIWIADELWTGVQEHELLHGAAGFEYHRHLDASRTGDGAHVPGACTNDHSVLQGPVWDWVEGYPTSISYSAAGVKLVANADCASCDDVVSGNCCTFRYEDEPQTAADMIARPDLKAASDLALYISGFLPREDVDDASATGYCIGTDTDGGCGTNFDWQTPCDPETWVEDADRWSVTSNVVSRFEFEDLVAALGPRDPPAVRDSPQTRQAMVYVGGRTPEEAEWTYHTLFWRYFDTIEEPVQTTEGPIIGWHYTVKGTNRLSSRLNGVPCGETGRLVGCETVADACEAHTCHANAACAPVDGGYVCLCGRGTVGDGFSCVSYDEAEGYPLPAGALFEDDSSCWGTERWIDVDPTLEDKPYPGGVAPYSPLSCGDGLCPVGSTCSSSGSCVFGDPSPAPTKAPTVSKSPTASFAPSPSPTASHAPTPTYCNWHCENLHLSHGGTELGQSGNCGTTCVVGIAADRNGVVWPELYLWLNHFYSGGSSHSYMANGMPSNEFDICKTQCFPDA